MVSFVHTSIGHPSLPVSLPRIPHTFRTCFHTRCGAVGVGFASSTAPGLPSFLSFFDGVHGGSRSLTKRRDVIQKAYALTSFFGGGGFSEAS